MPNSLTTETEQHVAAPVIKTHVAVPKVMLIPVAAAAAELCTHPMDFVKTQTQVKGSNIWNAVKENFKARGIAGFYSSINPAIGKMFIRINNWRKKESL